MSRSVYQKISAHIREDGSLDPSFSLYDFKKTRDPYAKDGAKDALILFHERRKNTDAERFFEAFNYLAEERFEEAFELLSRAFGEESIVRAVPVLSEGLAHIMLSRNPYPLINALIGLLTKSEDPELIKFALLALEHVPLERHPEVKQIIKTLALSDELTFFAALPMGSWPEGEQLIAETAKKVHGWGRIMLVPRLPFDDKETNLWLLDEGQYNDAHPQYNATVILSRSLLPGLLNDPDLTEARFRKLSRLFLNSLRPESLLVTFEDLHPEFQLSFIEAWLNAASRFALTAADCEILLRLDDFLQFLLMQQEEEYTEDIPAEEIMSRFKSAELYAPYREEISRLAAYTASFLDIPLFADIVLREKGEIGLHKMGALSGLLENPQDVLDLLSLDPEENIDAIGILSGYPYYYEKMLERFADVLPLNEMAQGPRAERQGNDLSFSEILLIEILISLRQHHGAGRPFLICGLQSSHVSCRLTALLTLDFWMYQAPVPLKLFDPDIFRLLQVLSEYEENPVNRFYLREILSMHVRKI